MAFARTLGVTFPMLSDWDSDVAAAYGVRYDTWKGHRRLAKRSVFVVDQERIVRYRWWTDDAEIVPDLDPALSAIEGFAG